MFFLRIAAVTVVVGAAPTSAQPRTPGQLIVIPAGAPPEVGALIAGHRVIERSVFGEAVLIEVPAGHEIAIAAAIGAMESVVSAELNYTGRGASVSDDTFFSAQWHHDNTGQLGGTIGADIESVGAWAHTRGDGSTVIAVLDTGIDSDHPELAGRFLGNGFDFVNEDADPEADHPHGPWVTGCIVANDGNGFGIAGVDHRARVLPVKVLNQSNTGSTFDLIQGIDFAAARSDVSIICLSLINFPSTNALQSSLSSAASAGKVLISCGANNGGNADVSWPGASPVTITIGATGRDDARASFSGFGASIDFVAPGQGVVTIEPFTDLDRTDTVTGCSFATPIVAGVAGLIRARARELGVPFTQQLVFDMLRAGAEDLVGDPVEDIAGRDDFMGWGRVNARASLDALEAQFGCVADTNRDGALSPADFNAWILAYNSRSLAICDQDGDGDCDPADFNAWIFSFNNGC